jgi:outer membrane protein
MRIGITAALLLAACVVAQSVAVIDSDRIFETLGEVSDARELLETEIDEYEAHADSLQDEIDQLERELSRTLMMSPETRRDKERLLEEKLGELEGYLSEVFGPGGLVESRNEELVSPIVASINEAVQEISNEEDFQLVIDASEGLVVFAEPSIDITDQVIDRLAAGGSGD